LKTSIDYRNLRNLSEQLLNNLHSFEFSAVVQRSKRGNPCNCLSNGRIDKCRFEVMGPAVNHPMTDAVDGSRFGYGCRRPVPQ